MAKLNISLAQMHIALGDVTRNQSKMEALVAEAARRKSHVVVLPELWSTGYALAEAKSYADELSKGMFAAISKTATQNKIAIVGSILEKRGLEVLHKLVVDLLNDGKSQEAQELAKRLPKD